MRPYLIYRYLCFVLVSLLLLRIPSPSCAIETRETKSKVLAHYTMGLIHDMNGLPERAIYEYKKAVKLDEANYLIRYKLGSNYARLGMLPEAIAELNLVAKLQPDDLQAHYLLALIYSTQKEYKKASDEYEIILKAFAEEDPENVEVYAYLAQLYYSQGRLQKAGEQFEKILDLDPTNSDIMYLLGSLYLEMDARDKAIDIFKDAIIVNPDHDGCLNSLAYVYAENGINLDEALDFANKAVDLDPENGAYLDTLGWVYFKKGKYLQALEYLQQADDLLQDPVIYEHMGDTYRELGQEDKAKKYWNLSIELLPNQKKLKEKIDFLDEERSVQKTREE